MGDKQAYDGDYRAVLYNGHRRVSGCAGQNGARMASYVCSLPTRLARAHCLAQAGAAWHSVARADHLAEV